MQNLFRLNRVTFKNYRLFRELKLELHPTLTVLHAENAGGKTAALAGVTTMVGAALQYAQGNIAPSDVHERIQGDGFTRTPAAECRLSAEGVVADEPIEWARQRSGPMGRTNNVEVKDVRARLEDLWATEGTDWPVVAAYGTQRLQGIVKDTSQKRGPTKRDDGYMDALDPRSKENQLLNWLRQATTLRLQRGAAPPELEALERALSNALPSSITRGVKQVTYDVLNDEPVIQHADRAFTPWTQLSDGYHVFLGMVADLARRCVTLNPQHGVNAVERAQGVVVIDEIDLHLHPRWQREALTGLQRTFPQLQFVVSTHSPQVLSSVANDQVRTLARGELVASPPVQGRDTNSILMEAFNTAKRPPATEEEKTLEQFERALEDDDIEHARTLLTKLRDAWGNLAPEVVRGETLLRAARE